MSGRNEDSSGGSGSETPTPKPKPNPASGAGGGGGGGGPDACDIVQTALLNSPKPAVVARLAPGAELDVVLAESTGRPVLEVHDVTGAPAGALTHMGHVAIIRCMEQGHSYKALVTAVTGGQVTVRIQRA